MENRELISDHPHLKGVKVTKCKTKSQVQMHIVLGSGEYARIKIKTPPKTGKEYEFIAQLTKFGWFIMSQDRNLMGR